MIGLILAAGKSTRIYKKIGKNKCLIKVSGKSLINRIIFNLKSNNIKKIIVVTGFKKKKIVTNISYKNIKFVNNYRYNTTEMLESLMIGLKNVNDEVIISYSDIIYNKNVIKKILNLKKKNEIILPVLNNWKKIWKIKNKNIYKDAESLSFTKENYLRDIGKKIKKIKKVQGQYMGIIYLSKEKVNYVKEKFLKLRNKKIHLTKFINYLINDGAKIKCLLINDNWYEFDDFEDMKNYKNFFNKNVN